MPIVSREEDHVCEYSVHFDSLGFSSNLQILNVPFIRFPEFVDFLSSDRVIPSDRASKGFEIVELEKIL